MIEWDNNIDSEALSEPRGMKLTHTQQDKRYSTTQQEEEIQQEGQGEMIEWDNNIDSEALSEPRGMKLGRSSTSGITATVFGATGNVGRYVVNALGLFVVVVVVVVVVLVLVRCQWQRGM